MPPSMSHGIFGILPREVRNQIYEYTLCKVYVVFGQAFWDKQPGEEPYPAPFPADLAILRTSKAIKEEAERIMYTKALFRWAIDLEHCPCERSELVLPSHVSDSQADRMRHIEFIFNMRDLGDCIDYLDDVLYNFEQIGDAIFRTRSRSCERNDDTCRIVLWSWDIVCTPTAFMDLQLFQWVGDFMSDFTTFDLVIESKYRQEE
ncbi:hypothetical protein P7C71_g3223, partial [Lecanoromycetidae sp. Uapishka_2]